ncbi:MAG: hypothetical protein ACYC3X_21010 [Pirellulaceae bacterium]
MGSGMPTGSGYPGAPGAGMPMGAGYPGASGSGVPGAPGSPPGYAGTTAEPAPAQRETFLMKAERSMQLGNEKQAFDYLYASALAEEGTEVLDKFLWVNAFKRPAVAVRWAIGFQLAVSPKNYEGSYYPVGSTQTIPERPTRSRRNNTGTAAAAPGSSTPGKGMPAGLSAGGMPGMPGSGGMYPGAGGSAASAGSEELTKATGELGDELRRRLKEKIESGEYGTILVQLASAASRPAARNMAGSAGPSGGGYPGMPTGSGPGGYPGMPTGMPTGSPGSSAGYPGMPTGMPTGSPGSSAGYPGMPTGAPTGSPGSSAGYPGMPTGMPTGSPGSSAGYPGMPTGMPTGSPGSSAGYPGMPTGMPTGSPGSSAGYPGMPTGAPTGSPGSSAGYPGMPTGMPTGSPGSNASGMPPGGPGTPPGSVGGTTPAATPPGEATPPAPGADSAAGGNFVPPVPPGANPGGAPGMPPLSGPGGYPGMPSGAPGATPGSVGGFVPPTPPGTSPGGGAPPPGSGPGGYPGMPSGAPGATLGSGPGSYPGMPTGAGMMPPGLSPPGPGMGSGSAGGAPGAVNPMSLMVGVSMLGEGSTKELLEKAADQGIDVLVVYEIEVNENQKTNLVVNETRIVVYDVAKGEDLEKSKPLNNIAIQKLRAENEKKDEEDPVTACFAKLFKMLDDDPEKGLKMREIPAEIKPEHVESRVAAILAREDIARLPALAEIKFFHHRGLVSDGLLTKSFQKVLGEAEGAKLATGTEAERLEVIGTLLPSDK